MEEGQKEIRVQQEKVRLMKLHENMEARRQLLPKGTSLHSNPLAAPLMIPPATFHTLSDTVTSRDDLLTSSDPAPEPEAPPAAPSILQQILSALPKTFPTSAPKVNYHQVDSIL